MPKRHGEHGAALVTALMLTTLALVVALALLYTVSAGTKVSASQKRYRSALAAAHGGVELATQEIIPQVLLGPLSLALPPGATIESKLQDDFALIGLKVAGAGCLREKLTTPTAQWSALCAGTGSSDPADGPDLSFNLGGLPADPGYQVSMKVTDSVPGNSDTDSVDLLEQGNSVAAGADPVLVHPQQVPNLFSIAVQGVGGSPREKARLSLLYAY